MGTTRTSHSRESTLATPSRVILALGVVFVHGLVLNSAISIEGGGIRVGNSPDGSAFIVYMLGDTPSSSIALAPLHLRPPILPFPHLHRAGELRVGRGGPDANDHESRHDEPSAPFERLIPEAKPLDSQRLVESCNDSEELGTERRSDLATAVFLLRIESDGHVSDMTLEESSGSERLDSVAQMCLTAATFEPDRSGTATASWQRFHWSWSLSH